MLKIWDLRNSVNSLSAQVNSGNPGMAGDGKELKNHPLPPSQSHLPLSWGAPELSRDERFHPKGVPKVDNPCCASLQVTVMHSMQAGYLEKAQKYTDKALMQLEKLKSKEKGVGIQLECRKIQENPIIYSSFKPILQPC